jgi:hypothetical protein
VLRWLLLERIKAAAHKRDVPYQSLVKIWLPEKLDQGSAHPLRRAADVLHLRHWLERRHA